MSQIIPSRLYLPKVFESVSVYKRDGDGLKLLRSDPSIEQQMTEWVRSTRNLISGFGPMSVMASDMGDQWIETRAIALSYVPSVENNDNARPYGQLATDNSPERTALVAAGILTQGDEKGPAGGDARTTNAVPVEKSGQDKAGSDRGGGLRLPTAVPKTLP